MGVAAVVEVTVVGPVDVAILVDEVAIGVVAAAA